MPVTWLKHKYAVGKTTGRYRSSHNDGRRRGRTRRSLPDRERARVRASQPRVVLVLGANGKKRFVREEATGE